MLAVWSVTTMAARQPDIQKHVLYYRSVDQHGDSLTLSGLVSLPANNAPKGVVFVPHYTISAKSEAPSVKPTSEAKYLGEEYVLIMPDYIGYGVTEDRIHPYLHGELTARNCVDMIIAAQPMLDSMQLNIPIDSIYIVGYSQGGASAIWTLKLLEEQYSDRIHVKRCFIGAGPYDVAATYDEAIRTNRVGSPLVIPMLVIGTGEAYDVPIDRSRFFTPAMEKKYVKYIRDKEYGIVTIFFKTLNHKVSHWLTPAALDKNHPDTQRFYRLLQRSSLVGDTFCSDWTPQAPLYVFHSTTDDIVTFRCAQNLQRCYPNQPNITYDFDDYGSHLRSSYTFYDKVANMLNKQEYK